MKSVVRHSNTAPCAPRLRKTSPQTAVSVYFTMLSLLTDLHRREAAQVFAMDTY